MNDEKSVEFVTVEDVDCVAELNFDVQSRLLDVTIVAVDDEATKEVAGDDDEVFNAVTTFGFITGA